MIGVSCEMVRFVDLNPPCKDESINDPAIRRCIKFAEEMGCEGMYMLNSYTFLATDARFTKAASDPVGAKMINCLGITVAKRLQSLPAGVPTANQSSKAWFAK